MTAISLSVRLTHMSGADNAPVPPLALSLLLAAERLDATLRERLHADGWPLLSRNQSRLIAEVDAHRTQSDLARRLTISRQSVHVMVAQLQALGLLHDGPGSVQLSPTGDALATAARAHLHALEVELQHSWDGGSVQSLRRSLAAWLAEPPGTPCAHEQPRASPVTNTVHERPPALGED